MSSDPGEKGNVVLDRLVIQYVDVTSIKPNVYNPNRQQPHDFELLCRSIREDGVTQPIIVQEETREIVDGEPRWRAAQVVGLKRIPVVFVPWQEVQRRIATLRHNRPRGSEDVELSAQLLRDLNASGALSWAQDSLMLDPVEITKLLDEIQPPEGVDNAGNVNTPEARARAAEVEQQRQREESAFKENDQNVYRLSLSYTNDEAVVVRNVLGRDPASMVLGLCRQALKHQNQEVA